MSQAGSVGSDVGGAAVEDYAVREIASRHLLEQERLTSLLKEAISHLEREGESTELAVKLLALMERKLATLRADLAHLSN